MVKIKYCVIILILSNFIIGEDIGEFYREGNRIFTANLYTNFERLTYQKEFAISPFAVQFSLFTGLLIATFNTEVELSKVSKFPNNTEIDKLYAIHKYVSAYLCNTTYWEDMKYLNVTNLVYYLDKPRPTADYLRRGNYFRIDFNHLQNYSAIIENMHTWLIERLYDNQYLAYLLQELLLVNTIYLKIVWPAMLFTELKYFGSHEVELSYITGHFYHFKSDALKCNFLKLPIADHFYRFDIILAVPFNQTVTELEKRIPEILKVQFRKKDVHLLDVRFPRFFPTKENHHLREVLKRMGITNTFSKFATFEKLCNVKKRIHDVVQKIQIDSSGREIEEQYRPNKNFKHKFRAYRPFLYFLRHEKLGIILIGRYLLDIETLAKKYSVTL